MKAPIRAALLASVLSITVVVPVFADAPTKTHVSNSDCFTIDELTFCSATETDIMSKEKKSGETSLKMSTWFLSTVVDADGNVVSSFESTSREHDTVLPGEEGGPLFIDQNVRREDEVVTDGATTCTRYRILIKNETERINKVSTTPGPC